MFNIYSNIIYNENITYKNINNIIYNCKSQNTLLSHFFTLLLSTTRTPNSPLDPLGGSQHPLDLLLHLTRLWHVERPINIHYYSPKSIRTTHTF